VENTTLCKVNCNDATSQSSCVVSIRTTVMILKDIFKGAATKASSVAGPFHDFYTALLMKGMKPKMARLTLTRKIATITLIVWKKGVCFDAEQLKRQASV